MTVSYVFVNLSLTYNRQFNFETDTCLNKKNATVGKEI